MLNVHLSKYISIRTRCPEEYIATRLIILTSDLTPGLTGLHQRNPKGNRYPQPELPTSLNTVGLDGPHPHMGFDFPNRPICVTPFNSSLNPLLPSSLLTYGLMSDSLQSASFFDQEGQIPMRKTIFAAILICMLTAPIPSLLAQTYVYVCDNAGNLGRINVSSGQATLLGNMGTTMSDIAFDSAGHLYGVDGSDLYEIDPSTATALHIGPSGLPGGPGLNALTFGPDDTLYAALFGQASLYTIDVATGHATAIGNMGHGSDGDLAFKDGNLYLSSGSELVGIGLPTVTGTAIGPFGFSTVYRLATANNDILYGTSGPTIFSINTTTGAGTLVANFSGQGLGDIFGAAAIPEPQPIVLTTLGTLLCLYGLGSRQKHLLQRKGV